MTTCIHFWDVAAHATDDSFAARCRRCDAERTFPASPPRVAFGHSSVRGGQATKALREARRQAAEEMAEMEAQA